ncbi:MAG: NAD(P)H-dependent glycerol-3-phosphate dehydrogenase [Rickettsiales bacterium]|nr:MAG: NAD(P)H-dependent glycerol-3-phosphate dehydrogenase [Rickettsiales bacterium]
MNKKYAVIGGGSWGTALACLAARAAGSALIYTNEQNIADEINTHHTNNKFLHDTKLHDKVTASASLQDILDYENLILAVPSHAIKQILLHLKQLNLAKTISFLIATKGMCQNPVQLISSFIESEFENKYVFISGPNFAEEVARDRFAAITITSKNLAFAEKIGKELSSNTLAISTSDDIITVQIAGIVKNIIAIKSGILRAKGEGENAKAWLISQGLNEIAIIAKKLGGSVESLTLPAVIGDLVLTCNSITSRNTKFGFEFHNSNYSKEFLANYPILVEGVQSARTLTEFLAKHNLDLPIISSVMSLL